MGRGRRGRARGSREDNLTASYEFDIYTRDDLGNPRIDVEADPEVEADLKNEIGIFPGAIENFQATFDGVDFLFGQVSIGNNPPPIESVELEDITKTIPNPITLDLTAKRISADSDISLLDGALVDRAPGNGFLPSFERIEYTFTGSGLLNLGINELTLILEDVDQNNENGFQVFRDSEGNFVYDDDLNAENGIQDSGGNTIIETPETLTEEDFDKAINDINYIIDNGVLGAINYIRVSGPSKSEPETRIFSENPALDVGLSTTTAEETLLIQAEDLNDLHTYRKENIRSIGDEVIGLRRAARNSPTGEATGQATLSADEFNLSGDYNLKVSYFDENDGEGTIEVSVNGDAQEIFKDGVSQGTTLTLNESSSANFPNEDIRQEITVPLSEIGAGDEIVIEGTSDLEEFVRIDFFVLEEIL